MSNPSITDLEEIVNSLPVDERELFRRIYGATTAIGEQRLPRSMEPWAKKQFGSLEAVTRQKIVRVTNMITGDGTLFNRLRESRPIEVKDEKSLATILAEFSQNDSFRYPEDNTPEDLFGRVVGKHCVTASNVAKCDGLHGLVIFNEFNPLHFSREQVIDYIDVGWEWAKRARAEQPQAKYFLLVWNCLWRAGSSIGHGHAHVMLTGGKHYAKIEGLRRAALGYKQNYGSDYFRDLFQVHRSVGCALEKGGVKILAHLTPFKDNEIIIMAEELNLSLKERIYEVLACFRDRMNVASFNLSLVTPPLAETEESWEDFPAMARLVDRGDLNRRASDVAGVEIYASSVVSSDPFELARQLQQCLE